jgi:hypothetical protein
LDLLLTTTITPWQILWGKLIVGLRISSVLTLFLAWPLFLAVIMVSYYWHNFLAVLAFALIILLTCLTTAQLALFCSVLFCKTVTSLMTTYASIICLFGLPLAVTVFAKTFMLGPGVSESAASAIGQIHYLGVASPFAAAFSVPLSTDPLTYGDPAVAAAELYFPGSWPLVGAYLALALLLNASLFTAMIRLFQIRWRVAQ